MTTTLNVTTRPGWPTEPPGDERDTLVLSLLEAVSPIIRYYAELAHLEYEELSQDATIHIIGVLDAGVERIHNLPAYVRLRVKSRIIDKIRSLARHRTISSDAPVGDEEASLADLLPSPYCTEPLDVLLAQECLQEIEARVTAPAKNHQRARMIRERWDTALASVEIEGRAAQCS